MYFNAAQFTYGLWVRCAMVHRTTIQRLRSTPASRASRGRGSSVQNEKRRVRVYTRFSRQILRYERQPPCAISDMVSTLVRRHASQSLPFCVYRSQRHMQHEHDSMIVRIRSAIACPCDVSVECADEIYSRYSTRKHGRNACCIACTVIKLTSNLSNSPQYIRYTLLLARYVRILAVCGYETLYDV